jgi:protein SCO1/2
VAVALAASELRYVRLAGISAVLAGALAPAALAHSLEELKSDLGDREQYFQPIDREAPEFALEDADGRAVALEDLQGKVVVLHFVYTNCPDVCPLHAELIGEMPELVRFVTVPTDPEHDTPDVMRDRSSADRFDPINWIFLTGGLDRPEDTTRKLLAAAVPYGPSGTLGPAGAALRTCSGVSNCYICSSDSCTFSGSWQSRIENAAPGDTILLRSGTYTPSGGLSIPGGTANSKIVIANYNGSAAVIAGPVSIGSGHVLMEGVTVNSPGSSDAIHIESWTSPAKQDIELKNMDVVGGTGEAIRIRGNVRDLTIRNSLLDGGRDNHTIKVLCDNPGSCSLIPENITITNNKFSKVRSSFYPAAGEDLLQFEGAGNATVTYNEFGQNPHGEDCVDWKSQGRSGTTILFSFNRVNQCNLQGILFHQGQANGNTTIEGNYFEGSDQLMRRTHAGTRIINNIIDGNQFVISASNLTLAYNTFLSRGNSIQFGDTTQGAPQNLTIINNIFSGTGFSCSSVGCGSYTASNNVRYDTSGAFTCEDCPAGNPLLSGYEIQSGSLAQDAASGAFAVPKDLFGTSRPQGSAPDIGAHEIASASATMGGYSGWRHNDRRWVEQHDGRQHSAQYHAGPP